jgi:CRP-like cAMP-binding protein
MASHFIIPLIFMTVSLSRKRNSYPASTMKNNLCKTPFFYLVALKKHAKDHSNMTSLERLHFEPQLLDEIQEIGMLKIVREGDVLIRPGQIMKAMPLLLNGSIKILRTDTYGDALLLYHIERGDTCAMTLSCCTGHKLSEITAIAETDTELLMIPIEKMEQ